MDTIGCDYYILGTYLLNDEDGSTIKTIKHDHRWTADILGEIFHRWIGGRQTKCGKKTNTWEKLVEYLRYARLMVLADDIEFVLRFCSEMAVRIDEECILEYEYNNYKCEIPLHGCGESKAPVESTFRLHFLLMLPFIVVGTMTVIVVAIHRYKGKFDHVQIHV